ncbi:hypothetical protein ACU686_04315 [Yinghuangia aomiensis]
MSAPAAAPAAPSTAAPPPPRRTPAVPDTLRAPRAHPTSFPAAATPRRARPYPGHHRPGDLCRCAALFAALTVGVAKARGNVHAVGRSAAPQAATASDLYFALADIDAQVANVLLIGHDEQIGNKQSALRQLRLRRASVNADVQALIDRGLGTADAGTAGRLLAGLARYDALAAQAQAADDQVQDRPVGRPPALAVNYYLAATALMHQDLLPAADRLGRGAEDRLSAAASDGTSTAKLTSAAVWAVGGATLLTLVVWQFTLARRFRRILNPGLAAATAAVAVLTVLGGSLLSDQARVRDAKSTSFDPFSALARTRAVASDANADESSLPDAARAGGLLPGPVRRQVHRSGPDFDVPGLTARLAAFRRDDGALQAAVASGRRDVAIGMATNRPRQPGLRVLRLPEHPRHRGRRAPRGLRRRDRGHGERPRRLDVAAGVVLGVGVVLVVFGIRPRLRG